jgi:hypothetical protein
MGRVTLKVFTLAAAAIAPHLIALDAKAVQVKQIEKLSGEERIVMKDLTEKAVYARPQLNGLSSD